LSTLTKILVVLLAVSTILLCGVVIQYVTKSEDYKDISKKLDNDLKIAKANEAAAKKDFNENKEKTENLRKELDTQINNLKNELTTLQNEQKNAERQRSELEQKVTSMAAVVETASQTAKQQTELFEKAQNELKSVKEEQIKEQEELQQTSDKLIEKMSIIETLEKDKKRLTEQLMDSQKRLDGLLVPGGKETSLVQPVTPESTKVKQTSPKQPAAPVSDIALQAKVTEVDKKNSLASISIGSTDGVSEGMKFHVVRGEAFVCDIKITHVEPEQSVGSLELVTEAPVVGDTASTNF
jgi:predicted RNase H-like nuclease (RuvC/YqgF family)